MKLESDPYQCKYRYFAIFQVALSGFLSLMMLINITLVHSPLLLSMQLPFTVTLFFDILYRSSLDPMFLENKANLCQLLVMVYLIYLGLVVFEAEMSLNSPFYIVLQSINICLLLGILLRYVHRIRTLLRPMNRLSETLLSMESQSNV